MSLDTVRRLLEFCWVTCAPATSCLSRIGELQETLLSLGSKKPNNYSEAKASWDLDG